LNKVNIKNKLEFVAVSSDNRRPWSLTATMAEPPAENPVLAGVQAGDYDYTAQVLILSYLQLEPLQV
jgi:hypothetical protein